MNQELASYIVELDEAARRTKRAEDRPLYKMYLASAAVILALVELDASDEIIRAKVQEHERLWGQTWPIDEVYKTPAATWQRIKAAL